MLSLPNQTIRMVIQIRSLPVPIHSGEGELTAGQLNLKQRLNMRSFPDEVLAYRRCGSNIRVLNGFTSSSTGCFPIERSAEVFTTIRWAFEGETFMPAAS